MAVVSTVDATLYLTGEMECAVMGEGFHRGFTAAEKTELWDRWKRGESLKAIGRAFGKPSSSIRQRPAAVEEVESKAGARKRPERGWCHFPFALEPLVFACGGPAASLASRSAFRRSRLLEKAFCAISCSVIAFLASTWRNALRASRSALVICLGGRSPSGVFVISSPSAPARLP